MAKVGISTGLRKFIVHERTLAVLLGIVVGLSVGYFMAPRSSYIDPRYQLASQAEIAQAEKVITEKFQGNNDYTGVCEEGEGFPLKREEWKPTFEKYLKVNRYGNRAVIRDCFGRDSLLRKDLDGQWVPTTVNVVLDFRANPLWQEECLVNDLIKTDTVVRPENDSIDSFNFMTCAKIQRDELVADLLKRSHNRNDVKIDQKYVDEFVKDFQEFTAP